MVKCMEPLIEFNAWSPVERLKYMETHIDGKVYGDSYRGYNVWRHIRREQCMETHIEFTMHGVSYREYNLWRLL